MLCVTRVIVHIGHSTVQVSHRGWHQVSGDTWEGEFIFTRSQRLLNSVYKQCLDLFTTMDVTVRKRLKDSSQKTKITGEGSTNEVNYNKRFNLLNSQIFASNSIKISIKTT